MLLILYKTETTKFVKQQNLMLYHTIPTFNDPEKEAFLSKREFSILATLNLSSANAFDLVKVQILVNTC